MSSNQTGRFTVDQLLADQRWVQGLARALLSRDREGAGGVEDLVQDTWVAAAQHPPGAHRAARPWLATVVRNLFHKQRLAGQRRRARESARAALDAAEPGSSPEDLLARCQQQRLLAELVALLPEPVRVTVLMRYFDGRSAAQIARALGVPAGTVRWRLKRGLDQLRAQLDERQGGRGSWVRALLPLVGFGRQLPVRAPTLAGATLAVLLVGAGSWWMVEQRGDGRGGQRSAAPPPAALTIGARPGAVPRLLRPLAVEADGVLAGRVIDPEGRPLAGAQVTGRRQGTSSRELPATGELPVLVTGAGGAFRYPGLLPGRYNLFARAPGLAVGGLLSVAIEAGAGVRTVELQLPRGAWTFSGQVRDAAAGPIPGAIVRVRGIGHLPGRAGMGVPASSDFPVSTDADGRFAIRLEPFQYAITVRADGYARAETQVELAADVTRSFRLEPTAPLDGQVVGMMGQPIVGAEVFAIAHDPRWAEPAPGPVARATTDGDGHFRLPDLPPGDYRLLARKGGLRGHLARPVNVSAEGALEVGPIVVGLGVELRGRVRDGDRPAAGARVQLVATTAGGDGWAGIPDATPVTVSDDDGQFRLYCFPPGPYRLEVFDRQQARRLVEPVRVSGPLTRDLVLRPATVVTGLVLDGDGQPVRGARISARLDSAGPGPAQGEWSHSNVAGRFTLSRLGPGQVAIQARLGEQTALVQGVSLREGSPTELVVRLRPATRLSGVVTWDDRTPAAGARLLVAADLAHPGLLDVHRADHQGRFDIGGLAPGAVTITAIAPDAPLVPEAAVESERATLALVDGQRQGDLTLVIARRRHAIAGVVLAGGGLPAVGARVTLDRAGPLAADPGRRPRYRALTGADGAFAIDELPPGTYQVEASATGQGQAALSGIRAGGAPVRLVLGPPTDTN